MRAEANKLLCSSLATILAELMKSDCCASSCTLLVAYVSDICAVSRFNRTMITRNKNMMYMITLNHLHK